jgi:hypothetical protein
MFQSVEGWFKEKIKSKVSQRRNTNEDSSSKDLGLVVVRYLMH